MLSHAPRPTNRLRRQPVTQIPVICVVDPTPNDFQGWKAVADARGARLQFVATAAAALTLSRTAHVDLWVVNTELPGLSGCELCSMLKARSPQTSVFLLADEFSPTVEQSAWRARATMFGVKPEQHALLSEWLNHKSAELAANKISD